MVRSPGSLWPLLMISVAIYMIHYDVWEDTERR